ncbi:MAG: restriction endonuclease subunit S [Clostridiales Family XIII bacterium]|jgi:type I restriction enzyme S subunit|nr:restriction endonuclease subunit S [Clostridiales Family XIII bacterium]
MTVIKPSGIAWIGDIPTDWEMKKVKYISTLKGRIGWQGLTSDEYTDEGAYLITGTDFDNGGINWETCVHVPMKRWEEAKDIQIENGDLLITKDGTVGKVAIVSGLNAPCSLNSGVLRISTREGYDRRFLFWVLQSEVFWTWFSNKNAGNSTILHLYQGDFAEFNYAIPSLAEQRAIAAFLYDRCGYIDGIVAALEQQVEILRQYKKALITETVTKGLDKSAPMIAVGFDVANEMPQNWTKTKVKYLCSMQSGDAITSEEITEDDDYPVYGGNGQRGYYSKFNTEGEYVLIGRQGALCGNVHMVSGKFWASDHAVVTYPYSNAVNKFLYYLFIALNFNQYSTTAAQPGLAVATIQRVSLGVPPKKEQYEIADLLDGKCAKVDALVSEKERSIETVRQYKKSLIYEYVTGKKCVATGGAVR